MTSLDQQEFERLLRQGWPDLSEIKCQRVSEFRHALIYANSTQNLTKLISPQDFFEGHVVDVRELLLSGYLGPLNLDLGSGCGVPGLLSAVISDEYSWVLAESEGRKADFLLETVKALHLSDRTRVFRGRAEDFLRSERVSTVVFRAVGPLSRVFSWIQRCSTWNNLVLLKGPRWDEEWLEFKEGPFRGELLIRDQKQYTVGAEMKKRVIVLLERVPRGTKNACSTD